MPAETVTHALYPVAKDQKYDLLVALLERTNYDSVIIFCSTKIMADRVGAPAEGSEARRRRPARGPHAA